MLRMFLRKYRMGTRQDGPPGWDVTGHPTTSHPTGRKIENVFRSKILDFAAYVWYNIRGAAPRADRTDLRFGHPTGRPVARTRQDGSTVMIRQDDRINKKGPVGPNISFLIGCVLQDNHFLNTTIEGF